MRSLKTIIRHRIHKLAFWTKLITIHSTCRWGQARLKQQFLYHPQFRSQWILQCVEIKLRAGLKCWKFFYWNDWFYTGLNTFLKSYLFLRSLLAQNAKERNRVPLSKPWNAKKMEQPSTAEFSKRFITPYFSNSSTISFITEIVAKILFFFEKSFLAKFEAFSDLRFSALHFLFHFIHYLTHFFHWATPC